MSACCNYGVINIMTFESSKEKENAKWIEMAQNMRDPETKRLLPSAIEARRKKQKEDERRVLEAGPGLDASPAYQEQQKLKRAGKDYPGKVWDEEKERKKKNG